MGSTFKKILQPKDASTKKARSQNNNMESSNGIGNGDDEDSTKICDNIHDGNGNPAFDDNYSFPDFFFETLNIEEMTKHANEIAKMEVPVFDLNECCKMLENGQTHSIVNDKTKDIVESVTLVDEANILDDDINDLTVVTEFPAKVVHSNAKELDAAVNFDVHNEQLKEFDDILNSYRAKGVSTFDQNDETVQKILHNHVEIKSVSVNDTADTDKSRIIERLVSNNVTVKKVVIIDLTETQEESGSKIDKYATTNEEVFDLNHIAAIPVSDIDCKFNSNAKISTPYPYTTANVAVTQKITISADHLTSLHVQCNEKDSNSIIFLDKNENFREDLPQTDANPKGVFLRAGLLSMKYAPGPGVVQDTNSECLALSQLTDSQWPKPVLQQDTDSQFTKAVSRDTDSQCPKPVLQNTDSQFTKAVSRVTDSQCFKPVLQHPDSQFHKPVSQYTDSQCPKLVLQDTHLPFPEAVLQVTDSECPKPVLQDTDSQFTKAVSRVTDSQCSKPVLQDTESRFPKPVSQDTDSPFLKPVSQDTDSQCPKPVSQDTDTQFPEVVSQVTDSECPQAFSQDTDAQCTKAVSLDPDSRFPKPVSQDTDSQCPKPVLQDTDTQFPEVVSQDTDSECPKAFSQDTDAQCPKAVSKVKDSECPKTFSQDTDSECPKAFSQDTDAHCPKAVSKVTDSECPKAFSQDTDAQCPKLVSQDTDSECEGYHSSDFEFITESDAEKEGLITRQIPTSFSRKKSRLHSQKRLHSSLGSSCGSSKTEFPTNSKMPTPNIPNCGTRNYYRGLRAQFEMAERCKARGNHAIPEGQNYVDLFLMAGPSGRGFIQNKTVTPPACMSIDRDLEFDGFDVRAVRRRDDAEDPQLKQEARGSLRKILEIYPSENRKRRRF